MTPPPADPPTPDPIHDERIMSDGRPAWAWWNEIQLLRAAAGNVERDRRELRALMALLNVKAVQTAARTHQFQHLVYIIRDVDMLTAKSADPEDWLPLGTVEVLP